MGMSTARDLTNGVTIVKSVRYLMKRFLRIAPTYYEPILGWMFYEHRHQIHDFLKKNQAWYSVSCNCSNYDVSQG